MKKPVTKIICATLASVVALGITATAGCSAYHNSTQLGGNGIFTGSEAVSNGGFAVEKGDYVYFVNGIASNTADNAYGTPDKGAIKRISKSDLNARNYTSVQTVVPQIAYSGNYNSGIFVYGDYIYYSTPSTARNSDGVVQNSKLELKRTKLDGTESMKDAFVTFPSTAYDFRFVEAGDEVYILYVATSETMFGESSGVTNLHSVNTSTGEDVLLAYNISSYLFDAEDKTNPMVYYTMGVSGFATGATESYNQVYRVCADASTPKEYDTSKLLWWDEETNRYINCGDLVFDGIGGKTTEKTPFNYMPQDESVKNDLIYTYTLETYLNGTLFYTRHTTQNSAEYLYSLKDSAVGASWNPVTDNPVQGEAQILNNGSNADSYKYIFGENGELEAVLIAESGGGIAINYVDNGKLSANIDNENYYRIVGSGTATLLKVDTENKYLYYSLTGGNGYTFYRINYSGSWGDYDGMHADDVVGEYTAVKILDLDSSSSWYAPEFIDGNILFASETDKMTSYNYIMAFNLKQDNGGLMTNAQLDELNKLYDGAAGSEGIIAGYADSAKYDAEIYANLSNAAKYLFYTADKAYVDELAVACNAELEKDDDPVYSEATLKKLADFLNPSADNDWADYTATRKVNGKNVYANRRDYYYSTLGEMTAEDATAIRDGFRSEYLQSWPVKEETSWWDGLNTVARVFFIIGMCLAGILVIGGAILLAVFIIRKAHKSEQPANSSRRIKVDTTDDKNVNVYEDDTDK